MKTDITKLKGSQLKEAMGGRPKGCNKPENELEFSDYAKCIRPTINGKVCYARIPIMRRTPESILSYRPIEDADDLQRRIEAIVDWYREMMPGNNIMLEFKATVLSDEECVAALEAEIEEYDND